MQIPKRADNFQTSRMLFVMCWIAYAAAYFGRISYYTALADMISSCNFTKSDAGLIGTAFFVCYGFGQIGSGVMGDRLSPFKMILAGLALSSVANLAISFCRNYIVMAIIWGFNGLAQSLLWSPILHILVHMIIPEMRKKACLYVTTAVPVGTVGTYLASMVILKYSHWNTIFLLGATVTAFAAFIWLFGSLKTSGQLQDEVETVAEKTDTHTLQESPDFFRLLVISGGGIMLIAILIQGMLKDGVSVWVPTMISDTFHVSSSFSVFLSMFLPVVSLIGPYTIDYIYKKWLKNNEVKTAALCLSAAIPPLCVLFLIGRLPIVLCVVMLTLITTVMYALNYVAVTLMPMRFSRYNRTSTATGLFNSITYFGCALSTYGYGLLSEKFGWKYTVVFWIGLAAVGAVVCFCAIHRWQWFINSKNQNRKVYQS